MKLDLLYYKTNREDEPVKEYLNKIPLKESAVLSGYLHALETDGYLTMPYGKKIKVQKNLYEVRYKKHRILYTIHNNQAIMLHAFKKQTQKTPLKEINLALKRMC